MAHVAKFSKGAMGHMLGHYDRSKDGLGDNVDQSRTELNYNLAEEYQPKKQLDFIHQRLSEVKVQKRADVNVFCDWVVTAPKDLPEEELKPFFEATHAFLAGKYGKENVVSAYVHMDETTPHLHFAFIPVVPDKRKGGFKVSAKECITRAELKTFHTALQARIENELGHPVAILNGVTKDGNKSIADLKRGTAIEKVAKMEAEASEKLSEAERDAQDIKDNLIPLKAEYEAKKVFLREMNKDFDLLGAKENKNLLGKVKSYTVPKEVWETQTVTRMEAEAVKQAQGEWERKMDALHNTSILEQNGQLRQQVARLKRENQEMKQKASEHSIRTYAVHQENQALKKELETQEQGFIKKLNTVLAKMPQDMAQVFVDLWNKQRSIEKQKDFDMGIER